MPLDEVGRRYAEKLFLNSHEEIIKKRGDAIRRIRADHVRRGLVVSGLHISAIAGAMLESISELGKARAESLLKAYEKSGVPFDDNALQEITTEVNQFCHTQQHSAIGAIGQTIQQAFGQNIPAGMHKEIGDEVVRGVTAIMARLTRDLAIKHDEVVLDERRVRRVYGAGLGKKYDVFVCHASEDKDGFVRPLASALMDSGLSVWYDEHSLKVGDSLRKAIDDGLLNSRYGIVVLSSHFFEKNWPQHELDGLMSKEIAGTKVILPIWHNISLEEVKAKSPMLAGLVAVKSSEDLAVVVSKLREAMGL